MKVTALVLAFPRICFPPTLSPSLSFSLPLPLLHHGGGEGEGEGGEGEGEGEKEVTLGHVYQMVFITRLNSYGVSQAY